MYKSDFYIPVPAKLPQCPSVAGTVAGCDPAQVHVGDAPQQSKLEHSSEYADGRGNTVLVLLYHHDYTCNQNKP